jgi:hypothetical protein
MSMNGMLRRIAAADIARIRKDEEYLAVLTAPRFGPMAIDIDEAMRRSPWWVRWPMRILGRKQLKAMRAAQKQTAEPQPDSGEILDLHKSWHGLHWLLCQDAWDGPEPFKYAILGGEDIGEDTGYGPPRLVMPEMVQRVWTGLAELDTRTLLKRYDGGRMDAADIYPGNFAEDDDWRDDMRRDYGRLRSFYERAAKAGDGVLSWID